MAGLLKGLKTVAKKKKGSVDLSKAGEEKAVRSLSIETINKNISMLESKIERRKSAGFNGKRDPLVLVGDMQRLKELKAELARRSNKKSGKKKMDDAFDAQLKKLDNPKKKSNMAYGGMAKGFKKGGYANCGASMKATQKSTNMMYGGMAKKKK